MNMFRIRRCGRVKVLLSASLFPFSHSEDSAVDSPTLQTLRKEDQGTGMDRLRLMFSYTEYGEIRPEVQSCIQGSLLGVFIGAAYGGFIWSKKAYTEYIESNQASVYTTHTEAKRALQDHVTINFAKGAVMWGWRVGMFTGIFLLASTTVSIYRGKSGIFEYILAGGLAGSLFRTNLGFRGMLVGGLLGSVLGTCGGCLIYSFLKISGINMDEIRALHYSLYESRKKLHGDAKARAIEDEELPIIKFRDEAKPSVSSTLEVLDQSSK